MITVLFWLLVALIIVTAAYGFGFFSGWMAHRSNRLQKLLKQATGEVDSQVDHYVELQKIITDLVDKDKK